MEALAVHQRLLRLAAVAVAVEVPAVVDDTDFEQQSILAAGLLQVEPALRRPAAIGPKDRFPRERLGAGQRMHVDEQRIVHAVELDGLANGRVDDAWIAQHGGGVAADPIETIEIPDFHIIGRADR